MLRLYPGHNRVEKRFEAGTNDKKTRAFDVHWGYAPGSPVLVKMLALRTCEMRAR